ncbi:ABC transporter permease protein YxdM [Paenibacillus plantiphilus]|uniref:ABC transporter permease protein YxdM n=1 Tax=Paenibacillus plantiphilus TaxID=2905650 RepID=A0ABM9BMQ6_9BACL|nr:ABC transporter permease [Paenibacillus plantiphilus]CAH1190020.1 ABC transporter permease protein YxdM [Paenibacillus plantiphilus]
MTFRSLALSGIRGNWRAYSAFFLSSVFSVFVFYMYASFIFHPDVINGEIKGAGSVRQGMVACEYIVAIFSFFFILYANSAFLKTRKKELGLYTLFGMTRGQMRWMLMLESVFIALLAITVGIGIGMLLSKLFFMAMAVLLQVASPIPFAVPLKAVLFTVVGFFLLFIVLTFLITIRIGRSEIVELLKEANKPKKLPVFSIWLSILSVLCLGAGYALAYTMNVSTAVILMLPILGLVTVGTYFLFTQGSIALIRLAQKNKKLFYNRTNMIILSQMAFKLKDNARILFMVSILSAVILTASGTFYVFDKGGKEQVLSQTPQTIGFIERGLQSHAVIHPDKVREIVKGDGRELDYEVQLVGIPTEKVRKGDGEKLLYDNWTAAVVSESDYNRVAELKKVSKLSVVNGRAVIVFPYKYKEQSSKPDLDFSSLEIQLNGERTTLDMDPMQFGAIIAPIESFRNLIVVDDAQYKKWLSATPMAGQKVAYGFEIKDWESALTTVRKIEAAIDSDHEQFAQMNRVSSYLHMKQTSALTLFIGLFVSCLFFIASGSMLYFKLFTELKEDEAQIRALTRIGMTVSEVRRIVISQVGIIFLVPVAVGIVHTFFAMKALGNLIMMDVWHYAGVIVGIYIIMQTLYFAVACTNYMRRLLKAAV